MASFSEAVPYYDYDLSYIGEEVAKSYEEPTSASGRNDELLLLILWLLPVRLYLITMTISRMLVRKSLIPMKSLLFLPVGMTSFFL
jgi:hypothetical protein